MDCELAKGRCDMCTLFKGLNQINGAWEDHQVETYGYLGPSIIPQRKAMSKILIYEEVEADGKGDF